MRRGVPAALLALLLVLSASPVAGHGNHVEADSQHSTDGTVVVEAVRPLTDGFLVLHRATADGDIGEPIGHEPVSLADGFQRGLRVQMNQDAWRNWPHNETLWIVFHADADEDGEFTPGEDPATSAFGTVTGRTITLAKSDQPARVLAERSEPQRTESATATIPEVVLPDDGYLVLRTSDESNATVVGSTQLSAGVHENVSLSFDESAFPENRSTVGLYAQLYTDDGDGEFTADDAMIRAGDRPVSSYFLVWQVDELADTSTGVDVQTPTSDTDVVTPTTNGSEPTSDATTGESDSVVPGFGLGYAVLALLVAAILLWRIE